MVHNQQKTLQGSKHCHYDAVKVNPDQILSLETQQHFQRALQAHDSLFDPHFSGYNGKVGTFNMKINMGPTQPPQRKGRLPQYSKEKLHILQDKCNKLEALGVLRKSEEIDITVEYLNPSFLVSKPNGGHRLVTVFEDVGHYSKPQPSLMPDIDSTLRTISQWIYLIVTDLTSAFYQIPLARESMRYCGIDTPYKDVRVHTGCAMGMPGTETALKELMCRVLGDHLQAGFVSKLADDSYCVLKQGTRPSKKLTNIRDVKRYLNVATIAKDGLLVARRYDPLQPPAELIIVPRSVLDGLVTALHIRLDHPTKHQMMLVIRRNFFALDLSQSIDRVCDSCHTCVSLKKIPMSYTEQSSHPPPSRCHWN